MKINTKNIMLNKSVVYLLLLLIITIYSVDDANAQVKWHPGHYLHCQVGKFKGAYSWGANECYPEIEGYGGALAGIQIRFNWGDLEKGKGEYIFKDIDEHLLRLSTTGSKKKRFFMIIETRQFDPDLVGSRLVPCYLINECPGYEAVYEGGRYAWKRTSSGPIKGYGIRFWVPAVRDRFIKLLEALGARYNSHSHFEGIGIGETSMGIPIASTNFSDLDEDNYYEAHVKIHQAMRNIFPNTITTQFANSPRVRLPYLIGQFEAMGTALGGPDVYIEEAQYLHEGTATTRPGIYTYYPKLSGKVALTPSIMSNNYLHTQTTSTSRKPSVTELLNFSRDKLKATHLFWVRDGGKNDPKIFKQALQMLQNLKATNPSKWKLGSVCPSKYSSCVVD